MSDHWSKATVFAVACVLLIGCGDDEQTIRAGGDQSVVEQLEAVGLGQYLDRPLPAPTSEGDWLKYEFAASDDGPICLFGTPYVVYVRPGTTDKTLFYLEGGGACWNDETCHGDSGLGAKETAEPLADINLLGAVGVLAADDPNNPFAGWNTLYVPYCDGSVFTGDNVVDYPRGRVHHRGLSNLSAAVDIMRDNFPVQSEITVSGSSAGGFGTFPGYGVMRIAYPDTQMYVLNDSGPGLQNNDDPMAIAERRENWLFEDFIVDACTRCREQPAFLTDWALDNDPRVRAALFSFQRDFVISDFLGLDQFDYRDLLLDVSGQIESAHPNRFKRYLPDGEIHTALLGFGLGPDGVEGVLDTLELEGTTLRGWIGAFLEDGPEWRDLIEPVG